MHADGLPQFGPDHPEKQEQLPFWGAQVPCPPHVTKWHGSEMKPHPTHVKGEGGAGAGARSKARHRAAAERARAPSFSQPGPCHPASHAHCPDAHVPCPEHEMPKQGSRMVQFGRVVQPALHAHVPFTHAP